MKSNSLRISPQTTPDQLKNFLSTKNSDERLRYKPDGEGPSGLLYTRKARKGNALTHVIDDKSGKTRIKRSNLLAAVNTVFKRAGKDLKKEFGTVLLPHRSASLVAGLEDMRVGDLRKAVTTDVEIGEKHFELDRFKGADKQGAYGDIRMVRSESGTYSYALKALKDNSPAAVAALRNETEWHLRARQAVPVGAPNYVVETFEPVMAHDGTVFQPMVQALGSLESVVERLDASAGDVNPVAVKMVRDMASGLAQIQGVGMAHRDVKLENYLVSKDGVCQLTDFGTAGSARDVFTTPGTKKGNHKATDNHSVRNKSPEWVRAEKPRDPPAKVDFVVDHKSDVFALGVAVFRLFAPNQCLPFDPPAGPLDMEVEYEEAVLSYQGESFCQWYQKTHGREVPVPPAWRDFLDAALHVDPNQRADAMTLLAFPVLQLDPADEPELGRRLAQLFEPK